MSRCDGVNLPTLTADGMALVSKSVLLWMPLSKHIQNLRKLQEGVSQWKFETFDLRCEISVRV